MDKKDVSLIVGVGIMCLMILVAWGSIIYVAYHFISKYW